MCVCKRIMKGDSQPNDDLMLKIFHLFFLTNVCVLVFQIMGCGLLGVGIWLLVTDFSAREITVIINSDMFEIGTYMILAGGGLVALLAFCGCCGTMREDKCILGFVSTIILKHVVTLVITSYTSKLPTYSSKKDQPGNIFGGNKPVLLHL